MTSPIKPESSSKTSASEPHEWLEQAIKQNHIKYFDYSYFKDFEFLGTGGFGKVEKAMYNFGGVEMPYALKSIFNLKDANIEEKALKEFIKELTLYRIVDFHPNILKFYGVTKDERNTYILVIEWANGGTLRNYLKLNFPSMTGDEKLRLAKEITQGIMCLHQTGIIHRDLNSCNILVHNGQVKIADLGLSKIRSEITNNVSKVYGHMAYIDPQCLKDEPFTRNEKSDIYALGVLLWELSSGKPPFEHVESYLIPLRINRGQREKPIDGTPLEYVELYTKCWDEVPEERPTIESTFKTLNSIAWKTKSIRLSGISETPLDQQFEDLDVISLPISTSLGLLVLDETDENTNFVEKTNSKVTKEFVEEDGNEFNEIRQMSEINDDQTSTDAPIGVPINREKMTYNQGFIIEGNNNNLSNTSVQGNTMEILAYQEQ